MTHETSTSENRQQTTVEPENDGVLAQRFMTLGAGRAGIHSFDAAMLVQFGTCGVLVQIREGTVVRMDSADALKPLTSLDFSIKAPSSAWSAFWQPLPAPGWHDIFALVHHGHMAIEGDLLPLMRNLQFFKDLLAVGRLEQ